MLYIEPPGKPLPRIMKMESFTARVYHDGQNKGPTLCSRCLAQGHHASTCTKTVVCRKCLQPGHKSFDCMHEPQDVETPVPQDAPQMTSKQTRASLGEHLYINAYHTIIDRMLYVCMFVCMYVSTRLRQF